MVETIFKQRQDKSTRTLDTWLTLTTPETNWKDKFKEKKIRGQKNHSNKKDDF